MDDFEQELRQALQRRPAPPSLKRKLMERRPRHKRPQPPYCYVAAAGRFPGAGRGRGRWICLARSRRTAQRRSSPPAGADGAAHHQSRAEPDECATRRPMAVQHRNKEISIMRNLNRSSSIGEQPALATTASAQTEQLPAPPPIEKELAARAPTSPRSRWARTCSASPPNS